ncbi:radical SAM family heme chaperone HemW [Helicobacter cetorum]|uniref:radical SAM family heme chaperone HemW n=1 Tax=Helicobacter cetorum TaxID=138563 RepID=UPI000CF07374|nr:radical SAM family heme chaperone HemW [Helicobacter cetorum]
MILYIHIPFCDNKCGYCAFNSYENKHELKEEYVKALCLDLKHALGSTNEKIESIFIGGGTPNTLNVKSFESIFECVYHNASLITDCEITTEANPELISKTWCEGLRDLGINRISLGVQSFREDKLLFLERKHSKNIAPIIEIIAKSKIENISIDLIYNTPLDNELSLKEELKLAKELPINHLSAYALSIEKNTNLEKNAKKSSHINYDKVVKATLESFSFKQYEVSNYARDYQVKHNLAYWGAKDYLGCGAGAVGCVNNERFYAKKIIENYIKDPLKRQVELLNTEDKRLEKLFLGLRCELGVELSLLDENKARLLVKENKAFIKNNQLVASDFFMADEMALWLL